MFSIQYVGLYGTSLALRPEWVVVKREYRKYSNYAPSHLAMTSTSHWLISIKLKSYRKQIKNRVEYSTLIRQSGYH